MWQSGPLLDLNLNGACKLGNVESRLRRVPNMQRPVQSNKFTSSPDECRDKQIAHRCSVSCGVPCRASLLPHGGRATDTCIATACIRSARSCSGPVGAELSTGIMQAHNVLDQDVPTEWSIARAATAATAAQKASQAYLQIEELCRQSLHAEVRCTTRPCYQLARHMRHPWPARSVSMQQFQGAKHMHLYTERCAVLAGSDGARRGKH